MISSQSLERAATSFDSGSSAEYRAIDFAANVVFPAGTEVTRLANGNTLINNWVGSVPLEDWPTVVQLIEVTPDKKVAWALRDWTTLGPASSTQLLDQPGAAERRELQR